MNRRGLPFFLGGWMLFAAALPSAAQPTPRDILRRVDENMTFNTARTIADMTIHYRGGDARTLTYEAWSEGEERSFLEFTAPARDAGSRFLRLDDEMWIFLPRVGKSVRIQGHMLRQGLMGSDFSYGDASENPSLIDDYDATLEREETIDGRRAYILRLAGKRDDLAYPGRRIWVDAERYVPLREERFARSGKLLKTATLSDVRRVGDRWYPFRVELDNALQSDTRTVMQLKQFDLDADVPENVFTRRHLESRR